MAIQVRNPIPLILNTFHFQIKISDATHICLTSFFPLNFQTINNCDAACHIHHPQDCVRNRPEDHILTYSLSSSGKILIKIQILLPQFKLHSSVSNTIVHSTSLCLLLGSLFPLNLKSRCQVYDIILISTATVCHGKKHGLINFTEETNRRKEPGRGKEEMPILKTTRVKNLHFNSHFKNLGVQI